MMSINDWKRCVEFHGHSCPGLAIGYRACKAIREKLKLRFTKDEEVVCVTENDACGVDAIQVLTGCTIGKGNLIYRATGKMAFTFFCRANGARLRVVFKQSIPADGMDRTTWQEYILHAPLADLFDFKEPAYEPPSRARLFNRLICEQCGEGMAEHMARLQDGKIVCLDCLPCYTRGW
jgi:formylmethanofuran dehydrogenase subunit E